MEDEKKAGPDEKEEDFIKALKAAKREENL